MKKFPVSGTMLLAIMLSLGMMAFAQIKTGGYKSVATNDERVVAAADFAVSNRAENHPEQEDLSLESVKKAEMQTVAGVNFKLCLSVSIEDETQLVRVLVYQNLKQEYSLKSWEVVETCN
jgi:hypothetical protein